MTQLDILYVLVWWASIFAATLAVLPCVSLLFSNFFDKGYIFAKVFGMASVAYIVFVLGTLHILPFTQITVLVSLLCIIIGDIIISKRTANLKSTLYNHLRFFIFEEILFLAGLFFWAFIRAHQPDIHGLEKFMDFGFVNSILRSTYFPPKDMWYPPFPINYYYFGHLTTAVFTRLTFIPPSITFNLMLATIFAFTVTGVFSLTANLFSFLLETSNKKDHFRVESTMFAGGLVAAILTAFGGNLHTIYAFFKPYNPDTPLPFWQLPFLLSSFPNSYWYPNATRFIYHTIHEFPIYSFVVSDLHGHVLDIPFVLFTIALLLTLFMRGIKGIILSWKYFILVGFFIAVMYMTNAWDGMIYFLLSAIVIIYLAYKNALRLPSFLQNNDIYITILFFLATTGASAIIFALPFSIFFQVNKLVSGIGVICMPTFLTNIGRIGPFLFEPDHCQRSPLWQLGILYGFFLFWIVSFFVFCFRKKKIEKYIHPIDIFVWALIGVSLFLIIIPEFFYLKDIYPTYYRANTMFKLVYQSFIMLSLSSGYILVRIVSSIKYQVLSIPRKLLAISFSLLALSLCTMVMIYPYFAIGSYYNNLQISYDLDGIRYLNKLYPGDYLAINWINSHIQGQPIILEAQGDSYTDYARISANTGLPTPLGWTVHEWLWRGSYDPLPARIQDIQTMYETTDITTEKNLLQKYNVSYIVVGSLERQKYPSINESMFTKVGKVVYSNDQTTVYKVH